MSNVPNQNGKLLKKRWGSNSDALETTLRDLHYFKMTLLLLQVLGKPLLLFFVTYNREHYKQLSRLRCQIPIDRVLIQTP